MRINYIQHVPFETLANIEPWALSHGHKITCTRPYLGERFPHPREFDWLIVMGGPMNVDQEDQHPWLRHEKKFIANAIDSDKTVLGICLGGQLIASALHAPVRKNPKKEIGWFDVTLTDLGGMNPLFEGFPQSFEVFQWHGDTFDIPEGCIRLAKSPVCGNQAFIYGDRVLALQFHLETSLDDAQWLIQNCPQEFHIPDQPYIQSPQDITAEPARFSRAENRMRRLLENLEKVHFCTSMPAWV